MSLRDGATGAIAFDPVAWWSRVDGTRTALIHGATGARVTYTELDRGADQWARSLAARGVSVGDRVAVLAHNRIEFVSLFVACVRIGAILVPLNWRLAASELRRVIEHAEPSLVLVESQLMALASASAFAVPTLDLDAAGSSQNHRPYARATNEIAMLLYTSGTTGEPKGVMVSHAQIRWNAVSTVAGWSLHDEHVAAVATPFFHTAAWHVFTTPLLHLGGCVVVLPSFDADTFLPTLARYGVTHTFCVPTQLRLLQQAPTWGHAVPSLAGFISGGAPLPPTVLDEARAAGYPVRDAYGLTECGPNCFALPAHLVTEKPGSVGWPLPFLAMRLADANGSEPRSGEVGELQLRGPQLFAGYFRDDARTAAAVSADGWFGTGDLAVRDADGTYRICGRTRDLFISGGENVYPGEVEAALLACAGVRDAAVVPVPDALWGEVGCAFLVAADPQLTADAILRDVRRHLAGYKVPHIVRFVEALPVLGSGKVDRSALRSLALAARRGED